MLIFGVLFDEGMSKDDGIKGQVQGPKKHNWRLHMLADYTIK